MLTVNERTTSYLTAAFRDKNGVLAIPGSVTYRIDCVTTNTVVLAATALTPATEIEIAITIVVIIASFGSVHGAKPKLTLSWSRGNI